MTLKRGFDRSEYEGRVARAQARKHVHLCSALNLKHAQRIPLA